MVESVVEFYYDRVKRHLEKAGLWEKTVRKFPPEAIKSAIKEIIIRCSMQKPPLDPEELDWESIFEKLVDHESKENFLRALEKNYEIPPMPVEERALEYAIGELEKAAAELNMRVVREEEHALIYKAKEYAEKIRTLRGKVRKLEDYIKKLEKERIELLRELGKRIEEIKKLYEELEKLKVKIVTVKFKVDCEQFTGVDGKSYGPFKAGEVAGLPEPDAAKLIEAGAAVIITPAGKLTAEDERRLEREFKGYLLRVIGRVPEEAMKEFEREISTLREAPVSFDAALRMILDLARDLAEKYAPPTVSPTVRPPEEVAPPVEVERVAPPGAPLEPMKFPRRLASSEVKAFWEVFKKRLEGMGLDPYEYMDYWIAFRDAWYSNWLAVLRAFENMIEDIRARKPVRFYPRVPPWKSARDAVLHLLATKAFTNLAQLVEALNAHGYYLDPEEIREIVKKEWVKKPRDSWLLVTPKEYLMRVLGLSPEDLPD